MSLTPFFLMMRAAVAPLLVLTMLLLAIAPAWAQDSPPPPVQKDPPPDLKEPPDDEEPVLAASAGAPLMPNQEYDKRLRASQLVQPLGSDFFGESVSLYNGATEFSVVDIDLPGNSGLPVRLGRRFKVQSSNAVDPQVPLGGFGAWDIDVPYMYGVFDGWGWTDQGNANRCSQMLFPTVSAPWDLREIWSGNHMYIPGQGDSEVVRLSGATYVSPTDGHTYRWGTRNGFRFRCIPATGFNGEGFVAVDTNGTQYTFDVGIQRYAGRMHKGNSSPNTRFKVHLMAREVRDRHGNWVRYNYSGDLLTSITANDGRSIELFYGGDNVIDRAHAHGRNWYYHGGLDRVVLPDNSEWRYQSAGGLALTYPMPLDVLGDPGCAEPELAFGSFTLTITHPSGAVGTFAAGHQRHHRSGTPASACVIYDQGSPEEGIPPSYYLGTPDYYDVYSLTTKTITGPGLVPAEWRYEYADLGPGRTSQPIPCMSCPMSKLVTVEQPDGSTLEHEFGVLYSHNDGRLLRTRTLDAGGVERRREVNTYVTDAEASSMPFPNTYGAFSGTDDQSSNRIRPVRSTVITQDSVAFTHAVNEFDGFARPLNVSKSSTLGSKTDITEYHDHLGKWVLGQVKRQTTNGLVVSRTEYDVNALPTVHYGYGGGLMQQTLAYNADGTVRTVTDGRYNTTTLSNWYRGIPRLIQYPDATSESAVVNANGWITAVTDENGFATGYGYDAMGRLASIVYPTGDSTVWNTTIIEFAKMASAQWGIPAGHWRQTVKTGSGRKQTYFDALWRPLLTREFDEIAVAATSRFTRRAYDAGGREAFVSYPGATDTATTQGLWTEYDALGRATSRSQDSEQGLLISTTAYLNGFQTRVTNPRGHSTTTSYMAFDAPTTDWPRAIVHPEGAYTDIVRDGFGKPTAVTRRNAAGSVAATRRFVYHPTQELCKTIEPETGSTVYGYDAAGNLIWSAGGFNYPNPSICESTTPYNSGFRVDRTYDVRNRIKTLRFPDGRGNQDWTYTPDGLPAQIVTYNGDDATLGVTNAYHYNKRRMLDGQGESVYQHGWYTYGIGYGYDSNGSLASHAYPSGQGVIYAPNALGQPTRAGSYATGVSYYPNGAIKQFTYGNGIVHTMTQNARQLPARVTSGAGVLDFAYGYDKSANVAAITDYAQAGRQSRTLTYDGLDRLTTAISPMFATGGSGTARYYHDVLDNLTRVTVPATAMAPARDHHYCHDASGRLTNVKTGSCGGTSVIGLGYDRNGNLENKNGVLYDFDYGNRLRAVNQETYRYDGHGRRASIANGQGSLIYQYSASGQLMYQRNVRGSTNARTDYVYLGGSLVAERGQDLWTGAVTVRYQHTDALGTPVAVTNANRTVLERSEYEPYGKLLNRPLTDGPGYTGHVQDASTGLTYMQQRYYDPGIGRFLSVDPVTAYGGNSKHFNRYWYATGNPYRFYDPDGRCTGSRITNGDGTCKSTGEFTTMEKTAVKPQTITSSMVSSVGPNQATQGQVNTAVKDANAVGRTAKAAGDSRAIRAFNKLEGIAIDSSNWDVATYQGGSVAPTSVAYALFNSKTDRGSIVLGAARYFDGRGDYHRAFRFMHEVFHFDTAFNNQRVFQQAAGCVAWSCQFERDVEVAARETMNAGWAKRDEGN